MRGRISKGEKARGFCFISAIRRYSLKDCNASTEKTVRTHPIYSEEDSTGASVISRVTAGCSTLRKNWSRLSKRWSTDSLN